MALIAAAAADDEDEWEVNGFLRIQWAEPQTQQTLKHRTRGTTHLPSNCENNGWIYLISAAAFLKQPTQTGVKVRRRHVRWTLFTHWKMWTQNFTSEGLRWLDCSHPPIRSEPAGRVSQSDGRIGCEWEISWLTDGVLNDWWGGWFGWVRRRPWAVGPNPSSAEYQSSSLSVCQFCSLFSTLVSSSPLSFFLCFSSSFGPLSAFVTFLHWLHVTWALPLLDTFLLFLLCHFIALLRFSLISGFVLLLFSLHFIYTLCPSQYFKTCIIVMQIKLGLVSSFHVSHCGLVE